MELKRERYTERRSWARYHKSIGCLFYRPLPPLSRRKSKEVDTPMEWGISCLCYQFPGWTRPTLFLVLSASQRLLQVVRVLDWKFENTTHLLARYRELDDEEPHGSLLYRVDSWTFNGGRKLGKNVSHSLNWLETTKECCAWLDGKDDDRLVERDILFTITLASSCRYEVSRYSQLSPRVVSFSR